MPGAKWESPWCKKGLNNTINAKLQDKLLAVLWRPEARWPLKDTVYFCQVSAVALLVGLN